MSGMDATIITGASSGIGRSLARRLAARGEAVALLARRQELLETLVKEIEAAGGRALAVRCDVTDRAAVREAVARCERELGPTVRLVANAGGGNPTDAVHFDAGHIAAMLDLNLLSAAHCIEAVLPGMLARGRGHLVAMSSLAGYRGLPGAAGYSSSKAALTAMMESLRVDLRGHGIDVTVLAPGFVRTKPSKPGKRKKPFQLELEIATERMARAIERRKPYYAFPASLLALIWLAWALPPALYDRLLGRFSPKLG
jgi:short-subunit dehydrogenase